MYFSTADLAWSRRKVAVAACKQATGISDGVDLAALAAGGIRALADASDSAQSAKMEGAAAG